MAPKRRSNTKDKDVSKTTSNRPFSKRRDAFIPNDESVINTIELPKNKRTKRKINKSKSISKKTNDTLVIESSELLFLILFYI